MGIPVNEERKQLLKKIEELRKCGICYTCHDLKTGEVFVDQQIIYDDEFFRVALEMYPRMPGHTILLYKPHHEDFTELDKEAAERVFSFCVTVSNAIKRALGAEKIYVATMCDGGINHFHLQLLPRYAGDPIGSERFVAPRTNIENGKATAKLIHDALVQSK